MQNLNTQAQISFLKNAFGTISPKENMKVTRISIVGEHAHKELERGNPGRINTWLHGAPPYMKRAESKIEVSLDNKPLS